VQQTDEGEGEGETEGVGDRAADPAWRQSPCCPLSYVAFGLLGQLPATHGVIQTDGQGPPYEGELAE
jgi:hypothetical protein